MSVRSYCDNQTTKTIGNKTLCDFCNSKSMRKQRQKKEKQVEHTITLLSSTPTNVEEQHQEEGIITPHLQIYQIHKPFILM